MNAALVLAAVISTAALALALDARAQCRDIRRRAEFNFAAFAAGLRSLGVQTHKSDDFDA